MTTQLSTRNLDETRRENDAKLGDSTALIARGAMPDVLSRFARAYLGMYMVIDEELAPRDRVRLLAGPPLADAVFEGFTHTLHHAQIPSPADIGIAMCRDEPYPVGYVVRAGLDLMGDDSIEMMVTLPDAVLRAALCFHYANATPLQDAWFDVLLPARSQLAAGAFCEFWTGMVSAGSDYLPGLQNFISADADSDIVQTAVLPLLRAWRDCHINFLKDLLLIALDSGREDELLRLANEKIANDRGMDVKRHVHWLTTAFVLAPHEYAEQLSTYVGRSRERALRMLDFVVPAMATRAGCKLKTSPQALKDLLLLIGPKFPPLGDIYGPLDDISQNVIWLFEQLGRDNSTEAVAALQYLRRVRVMRCCADVLAHAESIQCKA
jgi:hypothetical protein